MKEKIVCDNALVPCTWGHKLQVRIMYTIKLMVCERDSDKHTMSDDVMYFHDNIIMSNQVTFGLQIVNCRRFDF